MGLTDQLFPGESTDLDELIIDMSNLALGVGGGQYVRVRVDRDIALGNRRIDSHEGVSMKGLIDCV